MVVSAELMAYVFTLLVGEGRFAPEPTRKEFSAKLQEQYGAENFDPELGWIPIKSDRMPDGSRISPDSPASGHSCVSLYGDSFVFGDEVSHTAAWGNQLAKHLKCRVSNFGVSAYGTDQAYVRFLKNTSDQSDVVLLGILAENIVRNINQNRAFLYCCGVGPLKPIFWFDNAGQLQFLGVPRLTEDSYDDYINNPRLLFTKEFFIPNSSKYAEQRVSFPYIINLLKAFRYTRLIDGILFYLDHSPPWYRDFYDPSHPSHALQLTESIVTQFVAKARERGKTPIIMFIPTSRDIDSFMQTRQWTYERLYEWCEAKGYNCFDSGSAMVQSLGVQHLKKDGFCKYFCTNSLTKQGHYNELGNIALAQAVLYYLRPFLGERE